MSTTHSEQNRKRADADPAPATRADSATQADSAIRADSATPTGPDAPAATATPYELMQNGEDFQTLRGRYRGFAFPMTVVFLGWYLLFVLCSSFAHGFMSTKLVGNINVAFVFGLLQFLSTFVIAWMYSRHANDRLDPIAMDLKQRLERDL